MMMKRMIVMISWSVPINQKYSPGPTETICGANVRKKTLVKAQQIQDIESFNFIKRFIPINELQILVKLQLSFVW